MNGLELCITRYSCWWPHAGGAMALALLNAMHVKQKYSLDNVCRLLRGCAGAARELTRSIIMAWQAVHVHISVSLDVGLLRSVAHGVAKRLRWQCMQRCCQGRTSSHLDRLRVMLLMRHVAIISASWQFVDTRRRGGPGGDSRRTQLGDGAELGRAVEGTELGSRRRAAKGP